jgi:tetratricopeptide (TPR) repeat protein
VLRWFSERLMWKNISAAVNRFVAKSFDEAAVDKPAAVGPSRSPAAAVFAPRVSPVLISRDQLEEQFQRAAQLIKGGSAAAARQLMRATREQIAKEQPGTSIFAEACFKEAMIFSATGAAEDAEAACRLAAGVATPDESAKKERINYLTHLGDILAGQKKFDEAQDVLREALEQREILFGTEHPSYAGGLSAMADLLLARGQPAEALPPIDQAVRIVSRAKHERWPADLALRAFIVKAANGLDAAAFETWPELTRGMQKTLMTQVARLAKQGDPGLAQAVLTELHHHIDQTPELDPVAILGVDIAMANAAQQTGDHALRIAACEEMVRLCGAMRDRHQLALAQQALAMALDDGGHTQQVAAAYDQAVLTARQLNDLPLLSNVLRNYALSAEKAGRLDQADVLHREAVDHGASSGDWYTHGRSTVAYGIFLQGRGRVAEARGLLEEAVAHLPPTHPDFAEAQGRLAIMAG